MYEVKYEALEGAAYDAGLEPDDAIRQSYSGRAMYGRECVGLVHHGQGELIRFALALVRQDENAEEWLPETRSDSMGLNQITYWPDVTIEHEEEDEDDE